MVSGSPGVADVEVVPGRSARREADRPPDLLLEVAHGATEAADYDQLRSRLESALPVHLERFFFANTDVGAPELATSIARQYVDRNPTATATVLRSRIPRTFVDCNRVLAPRARATTSQPGEMTPGLMPWIRSPRDAELLLDLHAEYAALLERLAAPVFAARGRVLFVHTYAPRSVDVAVDERIVERLAAAYAPEQIESWPLRAEVDLIVADPAGRRLVDEEWVARVHAAFKREGVVVAEDGAYNLHPSAVASAYAARHPGRTLCFEVRRDLLVQRFAPFAPMTVDAAAIARYAAPFAESLDETTVAAHRSVSHDD